MTKDEVMTELKKLGSEQTKKTLIRHGAIEPLFGVKVGDMKTIVKKVKKDHGLSLALFETGNGDAMYLAGLIADEKKMTAKDLNRWAELAKWSMICEYTVPWIAAESGQGLELGLQWIDSDKETIASSGWTSISSYLAMTPDEKIDHKKIEKLLDRVEKKIHKAKNRERYTMNGFVISVGSYVPSLTAKAIEVAKKIGPVEVFVGDTACKVPVATDYIEKVKKAGSIGKKKKAVRC